MINNKIDYFGYTDNFEKNKNIPSTLIKGIVSEETLKVSVIIPTYKRSELLKETIDSVLSQTVLDSFEIIILDNDPDRNCLTEKLIDTINDDKILYYKNNKNLGMFGNWNRGIELSNCNWIVLIHDDDIMSPFFLEYCLPYLNDNSIAIIKPISEKFSILNPSFKREKKRNLRRLTLYDFYFGCAVGAPTNIILNKDIAISIGGFNSDYFPTSDYVFSSKCSSMYNVYQLPVTLGGYRILKSESLNESTMIKYFINRFLISSYIMRELGLKDKVISKIQATLIPSNINFTNNFYQVNYSFNYLKVLELKKPDRLTKFCIKKARNIFHYVLALRRRMSVSHRTIKEFI